jgi:hypothetical protein
MPRRQVAAAHAGQRRRALDRVFDRGVGAEATPPLLVDHLDDDEAENVWKRVEELLDE